ncbi:MAG: TlpA disulfide reductase family protein, partial [Candidatus Thermoplasmatota archaeon]
SKEKLLNYVEKAEQSSTDRTKAPDFTLETFDGTQFTLSGCQGKPVILDFMAVRCPPCADQMPELQKVKKEKGDNVVILSIDVDGASGQENAQDVKDAFGKYIKKE